MILFLQSKVRLKQVGCGAVENRWLTQPVKVEMTQYIRTYKNCMLSGMRTSMNLPDSLLAEAKAKASAEGSTVTQLVVEGLRGRLAASSVTQTMVSLPTSKLGRAKVDISDNTTVRDILDDDTDSSQRDSR
jgi:hypothetical protein